MLVRPLQPSRLYIQLQGRQVHPDHLPRQAHEQSWWQNDQIIKRGPRSRGGKNPSMKFLQRKTPREKETRCQ